MSLAAPWALVGLVALPLIWWIQRHRRKAAVVELPTLMFLLEEDERVHQPRTRGLDLETVLALAAGLLLALAAAGPAFERGDPITRVRVVVSGGAPAHAAGYAERVGSALEALAATGAEVDVTWVPERTPASRYEPRPGVDRLLGAARAGRASVRVVISDRVPDEASGDVRWIGVGDPDAVNVGIVGARLVRVDGARQLFVTVRRDPPPAAPLATTLLVDGRATPVTIDAEGFGASTLPLDDAETARRWTVRLGTGADALASDDEVRLTLTPFGVTFGDALAPRVRRAVERALYAVLDPAAVTEDAAVVVGPGGALEIGTVDDGGAARTAPRGTAIRQPAPLVADLDPAGVVWVYREGDERVREGERVLLGIRAEDATWPIVTRQADGRVRFAPDPTRGDPAPAEAPLWPLFIQNWIELRGRFGLEPEGLLDPETSRLGRDRRPLDPALVRTAAPTVPAPAVPLRVPLGVVALAVLGVLWMLPAMRRRTAPAA